MAPRFKGLSQIEIEKLMNDLDAENYADSDSDCENDIVVAADDSFDESSTETVNDEPEVNINIFEWKDAKESDSLNVAHFTGNTGLKIMLNGQMPYDFF